MSIIKLGVNIDHIATLRQARGTTYPDPVHAASLAEQAGADGITIHLREDRRHIQDRDVFLLKETLQTRMNLEMAVTDEMITIAEKVKPTYVCLVPEKREELTTEGGLDVIKQHARVTDACRRLADAGIKVSLFIDPVEAQITAAREAAAPYIELHTGVYAEAMIEEKRLEQLAVLKSAARYGSELGLVVNAGHGLHYHNTYDVAAIPEIYELNIGHAIVARACLTGLSDAVREMKSIMIEARQGI